MFLKNKKILLAGISVFPKIGKYAVRNKFMKLICRDQGQVRMLDIGEVFQVLSERACMQNYKYYGAVH